MVLLGHTESTKQKPTKSTMKKIMTKLDVLVFEGGPRGSMLGRNWPYRLLKFRFSKFLQFVVPSHLWTPASSKRFVGEIASWIFNIVSACHRSKWSQTRTHKRRCSLNISSFHRLMGCKNIAAINFVIHPLQICFPNFWIHSYPSHICSEHLVLGNVRSLQMKFAERQPCQTKQSRRRHWIEKIESQFQSDMVGC